MTHVFFHNDIDGVFSAALDLSHSVSSDVVLHSVSSIMRGAEFKREIDSVPKNEDIMIFDYQYHPRAKLWVDHHYNETMGSNEVINDNISFNHKSDSATEMVWKYLKYLNPSTEMGDRVSYLIKSANMIDTAAYPSAEYIFTSLDPAMQLRAYLECTYPTDMMYCRIVEAMVSCNLDIEKSLKRLNIGPDSVGEIYRRALKIKDRIEIYGKLSVIRQRTTYQHPRYAECFASKAKFNIRVMDAHKQYKISIGYNKWYGEPNNVDLGRYVAKHPMTINGGGHFNVCGCMIDKTKLDDFLNQFSELIEGAKMEKYAVDKENDPIEKKAQEMTKTGEKKTIDEARKAVIETKGVTPDQQLQP